MVWQMAADLVVLIHLAFVMYAVLGGLLTLRWRWNLLLHPIAAAWAVMIEVMGWICPLTPLENHLRELGGAAGYAGGFVGQYLIPILYPVALTRELQLVLAASVVIVNLMVYAILWDRLSGPRD